jgi:hypothetical protein
MYTYSHLQDGKSRIFPLGSSFLVFREQSSLDPQIHTRNLRSFPSFVIPTSLQWLFQYRVEAKTLAFLPDVAIRGDAG